VSTGRVLWLIWCLAWAGFWTLAAFGTLGLTLILAAGSVAAFWLPVGKPPAVPSQPPPELSWDRSLYDPRPRQPFN
jgi:hypothetical protein